MRKHISVQNKRDMTTFSLKKILIISIIFFMLTGMFGVMASNQQVKTVKIVLSSGYEMNVVTTSSKIADILKENKIVVLDGEAVTPSLESELSDNKTITIVKGETKEIAEASYITESEILDSYKSIVEKVVTIKEEIPFETITKDVSNGSDSTQDRIVQVGSNGIKEVTYRVKYQNGNEIEKVKISEKTIREPVDRIVEVRTKSITSRSLATRATSGSVAEYQAYAYSKFADYGWNDEDFDNLIRLWNRESNWRVTACNSSSGAYGIPQALPGSKMASYGSDYLTNYETQINWGLNYIRNRYSNPTYAWIHSENYGWY